LYSASRSEEKADATATVDARYQLLQEMGFPKDSIGQACKETQGKSIQEALNWFLRNSTNVVRFVVPRMRWTPVLKQEGHSAGRRWLEFASKTTRLGLPRPRLPLSRRRSSWLRSWLV
jgi:hypothetical protein